MDGPAGSDEAVVRSVYAAFARRDLDAVLALVHPDVVIELPATQDRVGRTVPYRGHDGMRAYFADAARAWSGLELHVGHFQRTAEGVMVLGKVTATEDGRRLSRRAVWTWRVRDGRVTHVRAEDLGEAVEVGGRS